MTAATNSGHAQTNFDFLSKRWIFIPISILLTIATAYIWVERGESKWGIDFVGGHSFFVKVTEQADIEKMRSALEEEGLTAVTVQSFEQGSQDYSIRVGAQEGLDSQKARAKLESALKKTHPDKFQVMKSDSVGATISSEVRRNALIAVLIGLIAISVYVSVQFEFAFAIGALVSLFHDVTVALGVYLWVGHELNSAALAAALTIVGYSVNDTIVIFDRVREEIRKRKNFDLEQLLNESLNFCLSRTIVTTGTTLFTVFSLLVFGGGEIQDLALFLFVGMVCGAYSTIYIASPIVMLCHKFKRGKLLERAEVSA